MRIGVCMGITWNRMMTRDNGDLGVHKGSGRRLLCA